MTTAAKKRTTTTPRRKTSAKRETPKKAVQTESVGVREFRADLAKYITGTRVVEVQHHGKTRAFVLPVYEAETVEARQELMQAATQGFEQIRQKLGMTQKEFESLLGGNTAE